MLRNIVDNAVRYARTTITATITVTDPATGTATPKPAGPAENVRIDIDDDGPGIPAEDRTRVFDRFVRLDDSRDRHTGNSGLGLAIAREITLAHHGQIAITQSPAGGTRVTIVLPGAAASDRGTP